MPDDAYRYPIDEHEAANYVVNAFRNTVEADIDALAKALNETLGSGDGQAAVADDGFLVLIVSREKPYAKELADAVEEDLLGDIVGVDVVKTYVHKKTGSRAICEGVAYLDPKETTDFIAAVLAREIQSLDPRILWDKEFDKSGDDAWEYVDYSFQVADGEPEEGYEEDPDETE